MFHVLAVSAESRISTMVVVRIAEKINLKLRFVVAIEVVAGVVTLHKKTILVTKIAS